MEKAKLDFAGQSINRGRRKIRESGCQKFRHDEERRGERRENTWREGKRQNTPRPPTHARIRFEARTNTNGKDSYGATNDWNDLHSMSNRTSPLLFLAPFVSPSPPSPIRKTLCGPLWTGYLLRGRCRLNLINSMRHLDKCAPRTRASKE